jgi:signal peptidase I
MGAGEGGVSFGRLVFLAGVAAGIVWPIRACVLEPISVATASMEPTLPVGRHLWIDKLALRRRLPVRGEIILFRKPVGDEEEMLKRVIALPGETVELRDKAVYVDGKALEEPYVVHRRAGERLDGDNLGPLVVPEGHLFVLGDNRDESDDSAVWRRDGQREPFVPVGRVIGLARGVY